MPHPSVQHGKIRFSGTSMGWPRLMELSNSLPSASAGEVTFNYVRGFRLSACARFNFFIDQAGSCFLCALLGSDFF